MFGLCSDYFNETISLSRKTSMAMAVWVRVRPLYSYAMTSTTLTSTFHMRSQSSDFSKISYIRSSCFSSSLLLVAFVRWGGSKKKQTVQNYIRRTL